MPYRIVQQKVIHNCPACGIELENSLNEAGQMDNCPNCNASFVVPGEMELRESKKSDGDKHLEETKKKAKERLDAKRLEALQDAQAESKGVHEPVQDQSSEGEGHAQLKAIIPKSNFVRRTQLDNRPLNVPKYRGLALIGWISIASGIVGVFVTPVIATLITSKLMQPIERGHDGPDMLSILAGAAISAWPAILYGMIAVGLGNAILAYRHMAINSFHLTNAVRLVADTLAKPAAS
jgi:Zn-finger nucleic acid-binding protein